MQPIRSRTAGRLRFSSGRDPFTKLLVANRGEIACRIIDSARAMDLSTVAVFSDADANSLHVRKGDAFLVILESALSTCAARIAVHRPARTSGSSKSVNYDVCPARSSAAGLHPIRRGDDSLHVFLYTSVRAADDGLIAQGEKSQRARMV